MSKKDKKPEESAKPEQSEFSYPSHLYSNAKKYDTEKFPWVSKEQILSHYHEALKSYMHECFRGDSKHHISDLSTAIATFNDVWWAIFQEINYHRDNE